MATNLRLDWATHEAAKYAVMNWHYSKRMPSGKVSRVGVWEGNEFVGCVIFGRGAAQNIAKPFGLNQTEVVELVRVALRDRQSKTSKILSVALRMIRRANPGLKLVVSYADSKQNHIGTIYQASNWHYLGVSKGDVEVFINGRWVHRSRRPSAGLKKRKQGDKFKYVFVLDSSLLNRITSMRKPYPKRATSIENDVPANHAGEGGVTPTVALQNSMVKL